ncbi:MAG: ankyrin repeat domain-containing protein [Candidatus Eremiobacteraeota bacterium]|nr:ankyrin repeat domain-containing protein [Candidatus Eremiobacteraeota bacterium]
MKKRHMLVMVLYAMVIVIGLLTYSVHQALMGGPRSTMATKVGTEIFVATAPLYGNGMAGDEVRMSLLIERNDLAGMEALLNKKPGLVNQAGMSASPLHRAVWENRLEMSEMLIAHGAPVNARDHEGRTALHFASTKRNQEIALMLIKRGAGLEEKDNEGKTPLCDSFSYVRPGEVPAAAVLLIKNGADVNAPDKNGNRPLHNAAFGCSKEAVSYLLEHGAEVNSVNNYGRTPLHKAAMGYERKTKKKVMELLVARGAKVNARDKAGATPIAYCFDYGERDSALFLFNNGAEVTILDAVKMNDEALVRRCILKDPQSVNTCEKWPSLQEPGDHPGALGESRNMTPLHYAVTYRCRNEIVGLLIKKGANVNSRNAEGKTPLILSAECHNNLVRLLLDSGADARIADSHGTTPLHMAACRGSRETAELLLKKGAEINAVTSGGDTPLHCAVQAGRKKTALFLLSEGADINARDSQGETPLHIAEKSKNTEMIEALKGSPLIKKSRRG